MECRNSPGTRFANPLEASLLRCKRARWPSSRSELSTYDGKPRGSVAGGENTSLVPAWILEVDHVAGVHNFGLKKNMNGMGSLAEKG
jgi:hypothetical protein